MMNPPQSTQFTIFTNQTKPTMPKEQAKLAIILMSKQGVDGFRIERMEAIFDRGKGKGEAAHRHDFYTIVFVMTGSGSHRIDFQSYPITDRTVFFISPGQIHQIITPTRPQGWAITFTRGFLEQHHIYEHFFSQIKLFRQYNDNPPLLINQDLAPKLHQLAEEMEEMNNGSLLQKSQGIGALLQLFFIYSQNVCILDGNSTHINDSAARILQEFKELVEKNHIIWHKVKDYAKSLHITPKYLNEVVKNLIGYTAKMYIQERLTTEARRLLAYSGKSVKEIAFELGFDDPLHFSGFFKKCAGISPTDFRNQVGEG